MKENEKAPDVDEPHRGLFRRNRHIIANYVAKSQ